jgi:hypothetical protein
VGVALYNVIVKFIFPPKYDIVTNRYVVSACTICLYIELSVFCLCVLIVPTVSTIVYLNSAKGFVFVIET